MRPQFFRSAMLCTLAFFYSNILAAEEGKLTVTTEPGGVEIWLGDNFIGNSPIAEKKVPVGRYILKLIDPVQRISQEEQVMITTGSTVIIDKKLKSKFGTVKISSVPEESDVFIIMPLGKTPLTNEFINPGKYLMEIRPTDKHYHTSQNELVVNAGSISAIADTLEQDKILTTKALARLALGAGAIAGFVWAIVENGNYRTYKGQRKATSAYWAGARRNTGITIGSVCVVGFEIVAFF